MSWEKNKETEDKQGGKWTTYKDGDTGEKIVTRESRNSKEDIAIFKGDEKVNRKN